MSRLKMVAMTSFHAETSYCLVNAYGVVVYVADLLRTCYGETGVMDLGLYTASAQRLSSSALQFLIYSTFVLISLLQQIRPL